jgi:hypothetical protein
MKCHTCSHPQRQAIDLALLAEDHIFVTLSNMYGLSISSLFRHKKHLAEKMRRAHQRLQDSQDQASLLKKLLAILSTAETTPKMKREKSAKLPKKPSLLDNNYEQYQQYNVIGKNLAQNLAAGRDSQAHPPNMASTASFAVNQSCVNWVDSYHSPN